MSPEQASGRVAECDNRSDIYSLGVILYQILTNRTPFTGKSTRELLKQCLTATPKAPSSRVKNRRIPKGLEAICMKALEKDPNDRYQDARAMYEDVIAWLDDEPIGVLRDSLVDKAWRWTRKNRVLATTILTSILAFLILAGVSTAIIQHSRAQTAVARARAQELGEQNAKLQTTLQVKEEELALRKRELADAYERFVQVKDQSSKDREALQSEITRLVGVIAALEPEIANLKEQIEKNALLKEKSDNLEERLSEIEFKHEVELAKRLVENAYNDMLRDMEVMELAHDSYRDLEKQLAAATEESERNRLDQKMEESWPIYHDHFLRFEESYRRLVARRAWLVELYERANLFVPTDISQRYCDCVPIDWDDALDPVTTPVDAYEVLYQLYPIERKSATINGHEATSVLLHADSAIRVSIPKGAERFTAVVCIIDNPIIDETAKKNRTANRLYGSWFYEVWFDERLAYVSEELWNYPDRANYINIPIPQDAKTMTLRTFMGDHGFCDHAYWCAPAFHIKEGERVEDVHEPGERMVLTYNGVDIAFRWCPAGRFFMGEDKTDSQKRESPVHEVMLTKGYWLAETETTQRLWKAVTGENPSNFKGDDLPVETVSWDDSQGFIQALNGLRDNIGGSFRLPTEAEWEYACRAGTTTRFSFGDVCDGTQANCKGSYPIGTDSKEFYPEKTTKVGSYPANAWGLHDMHGNIWEWCADWEDAYPEELSTDPRGPESGTYRAQRGGCWSDEAVFCRSSCRNGQEPTVFNSRIGFRLLLTDSM